LANPAGELLQTPPCQLVPANADNQLIALAGAGTNATVKWCFTAGATAEVSASVAPDGTIILGTNDAYEYGITPTGTVAWNIPAKSSPLDPRRDRRRPRLLRRQRRLPRRRRSLRRPRDRPLQRHHQGDLQRWHRGVDRPTGRRPPQLYLGTASGHILGFSYSGTKLFDVATAAIVASYPAMTADGTLLIGSDNRPSTPSTPDPAPPGHPVWPLMTEAAPSRRVVEGLRGGRHRTCGLTGPDQ